MAANGDLLSLRALDVKGLLVANGDLLSLRALDAGGFMAANGDLLSLRALDAGVFMAANGDLLGLRALDGDGLVVANGDLLSLRALDAGGFMAANGDLLSLRVLVRLRLLHRLLLYFPHKEFPGHRVEVTLLRFGLTEVTPLRCGFVGVTVLGGRLSLLCVVVVLLLLLLPGQYLVGDRFHPLVLGSVHLRLVRVRYPVFVRYSFRTSLPYFHMYPNHRFWLLVGGDFRLLASLLPHLAGCGRGTEDRGVGRGCGFLPYCALDGGVLPYRGLGGGVLQSRGLGGALYFNRLSCNFLLHHHLVAKHVRH